MNIYSPIAKRVGDDIVIEYYDKAWLDAEKKSAVFHKSTEQEFKNELVYIWKKTRISLFNEVFTMVGISVESLKDRLEIFQPCVSKCYKTVLPDCICPKYFVLKPEKREDTQDDIWKDVYDIFYRRDKSLGTNIAYLKEKFILTRK